MHLSSVPQSVFSLGEIGDPETDLADVTEVISELMARHGIDRQHLVDVALKKAEARGRFKSGAWMKTDEVGLLRDVNRR